MATLEEQLRQRALDELEPERKKKKLQIDQAVEGQLSELGTEEASIAPIYDNLRKELETLYGKKRQDAEIDVSRRGLLNSTLQPQTQNFLTKEEGAQVGQVEGERARKLAAIAERRRIVRTKGTQDSAFVDSTFENDVRSRISQLFDAEEKRAKEERDYQLRLFNATKPTKASGGTKKTATGRTIPGNLDVDELEYYADQFSAGQIDITKVPAKYRGEVLRLIKEAQAAPAAPTPVEVAEKSPRYQTAKQAETVAKRKAAEDNSVFGLLGSALGKLFGR